MDFSWTTYFSSFWMFPLFCLLFMAVMMLACGVLHRRCRAGRGSAPSAD